MDSIGIQGESKGFLNGKMSWPWPTFPVLVFRWAGHVLYAMAMAHIVFFAKSNSSHLPFKDLGSIRMSIGPHMDSKGFILGFAEDRCKDSKGIDGILKDLYKDSS